MHPLLHLAVIWAAVFVAVVAAKKTRLTPVLFFLFMGFLLVNLGVFPAESDEFIRVFAELGIIFIMFALGFEESTDNFLASIKKSWGIALFGAMDIAYVQNSILSTETFFTLMITAFFLNVLVPLTISWWRPHYLKAELAANPGVS